MNGSWSTWNAWTTCSSSICGNQVRNRSCDDPAPAFAGLNCTGPNSEVQSCGLPCGCDYILLIYLQLTKTLLTQAFYVGKKNHFVVLTAWFSGYAPPEPSLERNLILSWINTSVPVNESVMYTCNGTSRFEFDYEQTSLNLTCLQGYVWENVTLPFCYYGTL